MEQSERKLEAEWVLAQSILGEIYDEEKEEIIKIVIKKSKQFIGVSDDTKTA